MDMAEVIVLKSKLLHLCANKHEFVESLHPTDLDIIF
jgi:hypothetical protein